MTLLRIISGSLALAHLVVRCSDISGNVSPKNWGHQLDFNTVSKVAVLNPDNLNMIDVTSIEALRYEVDSVGGRSRWLPRFAAFSFSHFDIQYIRQYRNTIYHEQ